MASGASRIRLLDRRLSELARDTYADADARRLAARLRKQCDSLFTFLDCPDVPFDNDYAGRMIRPAVVLRKNGQCNRSEKGAATQAVLMSGCMTVHAAGRRRPRPTARPRGRWSWNASARPSSLR